MISTSLLVSGLLILVDLLAGLAVGAGIVLEGGDHSTPKEKLGARLVIWGVVIEAFTGVLLFGFDTSESLRQQRQIVSEAHTIDDQAGKLREAARDSSAAKSDAAIAKTNASDANDKAVAANALAQSAYDKLGPLNNLIQAEHAALLKARVDLAAFEKEEAATMAKATADIQTVQELAGPRRLSEVLVAQISDLARSSPGQRFVVQRENTQGGGLIAVQLATALTAGGWIDVSQSTPHFEGAAVDGIQIYCGGAVQSCLALGIMLNDWKTQETDGITRVVGPPFPQGLAVIVVGTRP